jgi:hypothetical protein
MSIVASGGLSTVMKLAASSDPKYQAAQAWRGGEAAAA